MDVVFDSNIKTILKMAAQETNFGIRRDEIVCIPAMLDIGDISCGMLGGGRMELIRKIWLGVRPETEELECDFYRFWQNLMGDTDRLICAAAEGETVRIWYSSAPGELCGFTYLNAWLKKVNCPVTAVQLPSCWTRANGTVCFAHHWGEMSLDDFLLLPLSERHITQEERNMLAMQWETLEQENAPLRAVISGKLTSVPEDFYDFLLHQAVPKGTFTVGELIGKVLTEHQIGVGDWWYCQRLMKWIERGELELIQADDNFYRTVCRMHV